MTKKTATPKQKKTMTSTAPKRKRVKVKAGQVIAVPLLDGTHALAHIATYQMSITCVMFACRRESVEALRKAWDEGDIGAPVSVRKVTSDEVQDGLWPVIGEREPTYPAEMLDTKGWSSTASAVRGFFAAYYGLLPWDESVDPKYWEKALLPGVPVPPTIRYKRDFDKATLRALGVETGDDSSETEEAVITEGPAEIHIEIKYPGDALPSIELLHRRQALEKAIEAAGAGEVTDAGGGGGIMDIYLQTDDVRQAMPLVTKAIADAGFDKDATVETLPLDEDDDSDEDDV